METLLSDINTYTIVKKIQKIEIENKLNSMLKK